MHLLKWNLTLTGILRLKTLSGSSTNVNTKDFILSPSAEICPEYIGTSEVLTAVRIFAFLRMVNGYAALVEISEAALKDQMTTKGSTVVPAI